MLSTKSFTPFTEETPTYASTAHTFSFLGSLGSGRKSGAASARLEALNSTNFQFYQLRSTGWHLVRAPVPKTFFPSRRTNERTETAMTYTIESAQHNTRTMVRRFSPVPCPTRSSLLIVFSHSLALSSHIHTHRSVRLLDLPSARVVVEPTLMHARTHSHTSPQPNQLCLLMFVLSFASRSYVE